MPDPALTKSLDRLAVVVARLNEESETLNSRISEFETALVTLNPGLASWRVKPIRFSEIDGTGARLGFLKWKDQWGLWVLRAKFEKKGDSWRLLDGGDRSMVRLVDATREERVAAVDAFPGIVEQLTKEAETKLALLQVANERAK